MVGEWGWCDTYYPPAPFWQDLEYEHAWVFLFESVCRPWGAVRGAFHLEWGEVSGVAGNIPGDFCELCRGEVQKFWRCEGTAFWNIWKWV